MIPAIAIEDWANTVSWPNPDQLEQDLTLARACALLCPVALVAGTAEVQTFHPAELVSTKLRALYQRSKGRDLFDLWLALTRLAIPPDEILTSFAPYRPEKYTGVLAIANLKLKLQDNLFRHDLDALVARWPDDYDIDEAAALITRELLSRVD